jgi:hypothetical protein
MGKADADVSLQDALGGNSPGALSLSSAPYSELEDEGPPGLIFLGLGAPVRLGSPVNFEQAG